MSRHRFIFLLSSAQRRLQQWIASEHAGAAAGEAAPSPAQAGLLFALAQADGQTMGELATALDLAPSAISGLVQRMEALGWVARQPDAKDGRTQRTWLEPAGRTQLPRLKKALQRINAQLTDGFSEEELQVVARWLNQVQRLGADPTTKETQHG